MKNAENRKQPISVSNLQDTDVSKEMGQKLASLDSQDEGEAVDVFVELNGNQAWNNGDHQLRCRTHRQLDEV